MSYDISFKVKVEGLEDTSDDEAKWVLPLQGQVVYPCNYQCSKCGYDSGIRCAHKVKEIKRCPGCNSLIK